MNDHADQELAIWQGLMGYARANPSATSEDILGLAPTFPRHMLGSDCMISESDFLRIAQAFVESDDYWRLRQDQKPSQCCGQPGFS